MCQSLETETTAMPCAGRCSLGRLCASNYLDPHSPCRENTIKIIATAVKGKPDQIFMDGKKIAFSASNPVETGFIKRGEITIHRPATPV